MPPKEQRTNKERLDELELQVAQIGGIAEGMSQLAERVDALEGGYHNVQGLVDDMSEDFRATVEALRNEIGELTTKVNLLVRAVGTTGPMEEDLFDMEQDFRAVKANSEETKVTMATMYLTGDAKLWWRTKYDDISNNRCTIDTWEDLKRELKSQFFPENV